MVQTHKQVSYRCQSKAHKWCRGWCLHDGLRRCRCSCHFTKQLNIVVPDGMLRAAQKKNTWTTPSDEFGMKLALEAALQWLAEHPIVPSPEQCFDLSYKKYIEVDPATRTPYTRVQTIAMDWQRQMFLGKDAQ